MSVIGFLDNDLFIYRVIKHLATNPQNQWVNTYEFQAADDGVSSTLIALATALVSFEAALHATTVQFDRVVISTWEADSVPYAPSAFMSIPVTQVGLKPVTSTELVALGMAWRVNRQAASGRFGNLFYRGALFENDVAAPAGLPILSSPGDLATILGDAVDDSLLSQYFGVAPEGGLRMVMVDATGETVRNVLQLVSSGVSMIKQDHMWFNRTTTP